MSKDILFNTIPQLIQHMHFEKQYGIKKISYAASFGIDYWDAPEKTNKIIKLLQDFDAVSVREQSGVTLCSDLFGIKAENHINPTL